MRDNMVAHDGEPSETLLGGSCDGLQTLKTNEPIIYAGWFGSGVVCIYKRQEDGRLHFVRSERTPLNATYQITTSASASSYTWHFSVDL